MLHNNIDPTLKTLHVRLRGNFASFLEWSHESETNRLRLFRRTLKRHCSFAMRLICRDVFAIDINCRVFDATMQSSRGCRRIGIYRRRPRTIGTETGDAAVSDNREGELPGTRSFGNTRCNSCLCTCCVGTYFARARARAIRARLPTVSRKYSPRTAPR